MSLGFRSEACCLLCEKSARIKAALTRVQSADLRKGEAMRVRTVIIGVATLLVPFTGTTLLSGGGTAWALTTGTGTENCSAVSSGSITYTPAWSDADSHSLITAKIKIKFSGCSGGTPQASKIKMTGTLKFKPSKSDNECTDAEEPGAVGSLALTYGHGSGLAPSTFSGSIWVPNPTDPYFEAESGNELVTGSFPNGGPLAPTIPEFVVDEVSAVGNCTTGVRSVTLGDPGSATNI